MKIQKIEPPRFPVDLREETFELIEDEAFYENCLFKNCTLTGKDLDKVCFQSVQFVNVTFSDCHFHQLELLDVEFIKCNLSNTEMIGVILHRSAFCDSKIVGVNFAESSILDTTFKDCQANYSSFSYATLKRVSFTGMPLIESDFFNIKWLHLTFDACNLTGVNLMQTNLKGLNLSTSSFEKINLSIELLPGCKINPEQSIIIAGALGCIVE